MRCYVAVCNNYAICNKLQTALNCSAVCNTSYFKLRCDGNAICNVLQIASKFYHLTILKRRKKFINGKMHRFNHILLWIQSDANLFELGMQKSKSTLQLFRTLFCPRTFAKLVGGIKTHLSVRLLFFLPIPLSVAKNFNIVHIFWSTKDITLMFGMDDPWKKSFQFAPCRDLCFDLDLLQGQFILPARGQQLSEFACKVYIYTVI